MSMTKRWLESMYNTEENDDLIDDMDMLYWELQEKEEEIQKKQDEFYEEFQ